MLAEAFARFVASDVRPLASRLDRDAKVPRHVLDGLAATGVLGALVPAEYGGAALSLASYGELNRMLGGVSAALQSLLTVHGMVCTALARSAPPPLRQDLLPALASGTSLGAFALTEAGAGNDTRALATVARADGEGYRLTGVKKWLSFGQVAGVFLVFASMDGADVVFVVRRSDPGARLEVARLTSGFRAAMLADLHLADCWVPAGRMVGRPLFGMSQVASRALRVGRLCVAFGSLGLAQAAQDEALRHASQRRQFGGPLVERQLVRGMLADTAVAVAGARLLCEQAARSLDSNDSEASYHVLLAKLAASRAAATAATACGQVHGALGLVEGGTADRLVRDARVMQIIEGSTELIQDLTATQALASWRARQ